MRAKLAYNSPMARGWESKAVEEQQAAAVREAESKQQLTPKQLVLQHREDGLQLSRRRILQQLQTAQNPRYRQMLETALSELDTQLTRSG